MIKTQIIDDWLEKDLINFLHSFFLHSAPHFFCQRSHSGDKNNYFYISKLNTYEPFSLYLISKLKNFFTKNILIDEVYANIQHPNMEGSFHYDKCDVTCLLMVSENLKEKGQFIIKDEEVIKFVQNRLIIFDSKKLHKGVAPIEGVRISLAFKINFEKH
tara:strand:+ start:168 stop:644 length:477 start_codon:yes stop_codon:yes gene_type:complete